jgi:hypothetical protein
MKALMGLKFNLFFKIMNFRFEKTAYETDWNLENLDILLNFEIYYLIVNGKDNM